MLRSSKFLGNIAMIPKKHTEQIALFKVMHNVVNYCQYLNYKLGMKGVMKLLQVKLSHKEQTIAKQEDISKQEEEIFTNYMNSHGNRLLAKDSQSATNNCVKSTEVKNRETPDEANDGNNLEDSKKRQQINAAGDGGGGGGDSGVGVGDGGGNGDGKQHGLWWIRSRGLAVDEVRIP